MARIFVALAVFASLLLVGNLVLAFMVGDFAASSGDYRSAVLRLQELERSAEVTLEEVELQRENVARTAVALRRQRERFWPHIWLGIIASLVSLLVHSVSITYFIGTSRWCREVVEAYGMSDELARRSQRLKRRSFPWALLGVLTTLFIAGLGAAADPYASTANPVYWAPWHWVTSMIGVLLICISFWVQAGAVGANYEVIQSILVEAERIRAERQRSISAVSHPG